MLVLMRLVGMSGPQGRVRPVNDSSGPPAGHSLLVEVAIALVTHGWGSLVAFFSIFLVEQELHTSKPQRDSDKRLLN